MAIYHLSHGIVSRSSGRSSVQSAAYITGAKLHETRRDLKISYQNRHSDIAFTDTLAPKHAPQQFHNLGVWDLLENFEDEYAVKRFPNNLEYRDRYLNSAQTAQTIVMALPRELEVSVAKELVEEFALTRFVSRGLIVTYAIHDDEGNPHAHLQISRHAVNAKGELIWAKDREIVTRKALLVTRKLWASLSNQYLEREGFDARITEKSYADLGINLEPTQHRGWVSDKLQSMGITSRIVVENAEVFARNREALIESPAEILPEMTSKTATFTQLDLLKVVQKRVGDDARLVASVFEGALQQSVVVGEGMDGQIRYTTQNYKDIEEQAINKTAELITTPFEQSLLTVDSSKAYLTTNFVHLSHEQKEAVLGLTQANSLNVLIGRAGAGKTTTLKAVSEIYQNAGHRVIGASMAAMAASQLEAGAGIRSTTIHSWLYKWDHYNAAQEKFLSFNNVMEEGIFKQLEWYQDLKRFESAKLTKDSVLVVDEAGMVGTRQWSELLVHVNKAGAKLIAVGDDNQFKAIEAGDFFRELKEQAQQNKQLFSLTSIRRQSHEWMKEANHQLAELNIQEGLSRYEHSGHIQQTTKEKISEEIALTYISQLKSAQTEGKVQEGLVLAFTNKQTREINSVIREHLKTQDLIGKRDLVTINGHSFAINDKVVFLENDKTRLAIFDSDGVIQKDNHIKNGTTGIIQAIQPNGSITIALKDNLFTSIACRQHLSKVAIGQPKPESVKEYAYTAITHGYAVTCHKAQGQTLDFTIVAAGKHMDAKGVYVAMTRHRHDVQLFYAKEDFKSFKTLTSHLSRFEYKDLVKDYTIRPENEAAWQRVQEYRLSILDAAAILKEQTTKDGARDGTVDWQTYHQIKQEQINLGKEILSDFDKHQLYISQAGLTQEMLQITTKQKSRPLSRAEEKAKLTVELYGETAQVARDFWLEIRKTHPGNQCYHHLSYDQFHSLRQERNDLARTIADNYAIHREFVGEFSRTYGISKHSIEVQSQQYFDKQREKDELYKPQSINPEKDKLRYNYKSHNNGHEKYDTSKNNNISQEAQLNSEFKAKNIHINHYQKSLDTKFIKQELNAKIKDLAHEFLGKPNIQKATEWRYGNKGSICIHVAGTKQGLYSNFETGESGGVLKFIQDQLNLDYKQAFKWSMDWLGYGIERQFTQQSAAQLSSQAAGQLQKEFTQGLIVQKQKWIPVFPTPRQEPNLKREKQLTYMLKGRQETARFTYKDANNNVLGYVIRLEDKHGNKITPTLTYCRNQDAQEQWRWQGFGNDRPLYGLEQLKAKPNASVLIVEGEKTAEAAKANPLFKNIAVVTWSGGCGAVNKTDWTVLKDKDITIWPDNDKPGINAAIKIADILKDQADQNKKNPIKIVDLPPTLPYKWDLADKIPESINLQEIFKSEWQIPVKVETLKEIIKPDFLATVNLTEAQQREKSIVDYLEIQLTAKENSFWINAKTEELIRSRMAENPFEALKNWQYITNSYGHSFIPMTFEEMRIKTQEANILLESQKSHMTENDYSKLKETINTNPQEVLQSLRMVQMQRDLDCNSDIRKFTALAKEYANLPSYSRNEDNMIVKQLKELSDRYLKDEKFNQAIAGNELTKTVQKSLSEMAQSKESKINEVHRGFER